MHFTYIIANTAQNKTAIAIMMVDNRYMIGKCLFSVKIDIVYTKYAK